MRYYTYCNHRDARCQEYQLDLRNRSNLQAEIDREREREDDLEALWLISSYDFFCNCCYRSRSISMAPGTCSQPRTRILLKSQKGWPSVDRSSSRDSMKDDSLAVTGSWSSPPLEQIQLATVVQFVFFALRKTWETEKNMTCWSPFIRFEGCRHGGYLDQSTHEDWNSGIVPDKFLIEMHEATVPSNAKRFLCLHLVHHLFQIL